MEKEKKLEQQQYIHEQVNNVILPKLTNNINKTNIYSSSKKEFNDSKEES